MATAVSPESVTGSGADGGSRRARFERWRQERPFWGCAIAIFAGIEIYLVAAAPLKVMAMQGLPGLLTLGVALIAMVLGGVTLFQPHLRSLTGLLTVVLGPLSIMATNLGGFIVGTVLLVVGGGLMLAWVPGDAVVVGGEQAEPTGLPSGVPSGAPEAAAPTAVAREPRPAGRRPAARTGITGVIDTLFGRDQRKPEPAPKKKPPQVKKRPPQKRPGQPGPQRAAQRTTAGDGPPAQEPR
jgi:uncharacterized protein DUF6114